MTVVSIQTDRQEEIRIEILEEKMAEKRRRKEKEKKTKTDTSPPVIQEDTEMRDGSSGSDGY